MKLIVMLAICLPLLAFTVILLADSYSYARETKRRYPKNKEYQREFTSLSLRKQRQDQLNDWEMRFRLACGEEEYRRTLPPWHDAGMPRSPFTAALANFANTKLEEQIKFYENEQREKLHRLSTGVADDQVRR